MTTQAVLHDQVRQKLRKRDTLNRLNGALTLADTSLVYEFANNAPVAGGRVSVDMQDFHVWSNDPATKTATIQTIAGGDATHADKALVRVNATYTPFEIGQAINDELDSLPGEGLFSFDTVEVTFSPSRAGYDLTGVTAFEGGHRVSWLSTSSSGRWIPVDRRLWSIEPAHDTDDFASGYALMLRDPNIESGARVRVLYRKPFTALNLTTTGLAESVETISTADSWVVPILSAGAAVRLTLGESVARADLSAQGDTRRADEVSTSDARLAPTPLQFERQSAIRRACREQKRKYGA